MKTYTKAELLTRLREIRDLGWVENARPGNDGGVGNTLEDLLGIEENNLPIANASEWELKCQRADTTSLMTLFHVEPSPRALRFVPQILLPKYGWLHQKAGGKYSAEEMSFRQTIHGLSRSDRGFGVVIDRASRKIEISFNASAVSDKHRNWLKEVERRVGLAELNPQPYWGFDDVFHKVASKLTNCIYVIAERKRKEGRELFCYNKAMILERLSEDRFISAIESGLILIDFDARTGHNHGTKFRIRQIELPHLYDTVVNIF